MNQQTRQLKQQIQKMDELITRFTSLVAAFPESNAYRDCLFKLRARKVVYITKSI